MTDALFTLTFLLAAPFWVLIILLPGWQWTWRIAASPLIVVPSLLIYLILVVPNFREVWGAVTAPELTGLQVLLGTPAGAAAAWAHFIAFDLFVGRWMYRDSRARGISAWLMGPVLLFTILLAPLGLLGYFGLRSIPGLADARRSIAGAQGAAAVHPSTD
jgi:hypothetical protein